MKKIILIVLFVLILILPSCTTIIGKRIGFNGNNVGNKFEASFKYFDGTETRKIKLEKDDVVNVNFLIEPEEGSIIFSILNKEGNELFKDDEGEGTYKMSVKESGNYSFKIIANDAKGKYKISWEVN